MLAKVQTRLAIMLPKAMMQRANTRAKATRPPASMPIPGSRSREGLAIICPNSYARNRGLLLRRRSRLVTSLHAYCVAFQSSCIDAVREVRRPVRLLLDWRSLMCGPNTQEGARDEPAGS